MTQDAFSGAGSRHGSSGVAGRVYGPPGRIQCEATDCQPVRGKGRCRFPAIATETSGGRSVCWTHARALGNAGRTGEVKFVNRERRALVPK